MSTFESDKDIIDLTAESELRCEVTDQESITVKLVSGNAELFGVELALSREYIFSDDNIAIFTWFGCKLEVRGSCKSKYLAKAGENDLGNMVALVNAHIQLEAMRDVALANGEDGPRVMIVGPTDSGKSTTARILSSYAIRVDRTPLYVDIDIGQGALSMPGTVGVIPLDTSCLNVDEFYASSTPLVYYYGSPSPDSNYPYYIELIQSLAEHINTRFSLDPKAKASGLILNTCGWIEKLGYKILLQAIEAFAIDVVLIMGHDKLYSTLSEDTKGSGAAIVKLTRSGGVVTRDQTYRRKSRNEKIREYFYGRKVQDGLSTKYMPSRITVPFNSVVIVQIGGNTLTENMMPVGQTSTNTLQVLPITPSIDLLHSVLGVYQPCEAVAGTDVPQSLIQTNVAGFIYVVEVHLDQGHMIALSPCPGALPGKYLLQGTIKWVE